MRADRLIAIVLTLQARGRCTAGELAEHLEMSQRTIRRDLEALCTAGVPLYSERGRGGGWRLLGGHRIDLTGLTAREAQALFTATGPGSATALGPGFADGLVAARRKVLAALPEPLRAQVEAAGSALLVDPSPWGRSSSAPVEVPAAEGPYLEALREAVLAGVQVILSYEPPGRPAEDRRVHPHGLVCKRGVWYLVATTPAGLRTYRLSRVRSVAVTDEQAEQRPGFDLAATWAEVGQRMSARAPADLVVQVAVEADWLSRLQAMLGTWWPVEGTGMADDGRATVTIRFASVSIAAAELVRLSDHAEVLSPEAVRAEMAAIGHRLVLRYGELRLLSAPPH
ncbi:MAG: helix-turn-helix transcriptional regulator [Mycobacteriales bacterium]